mgnify:CR=1 FL=1
MGGTSPQRARITFFLDSDLGGQNNEKSAKPTPITVKTALVVMR